MTPAMRPPKPYDVIDPDLCNRDRACSTLHRGSLLSGVTGFNRQGAKMRRRPMMPEPVRKALWERAIDRGSFAPLREGLHP